ncbi:MAG: hypothetical protein AAGD00_00735 [Planctomycetota bacterium]
MHRTFMFLPLAFAPIACTVPSTTDLSYDTQLLNETIVDRPRLLLDGSQVTKNAGVFTADTWTSTGNTEPHIFQVDDDGLDMGGYGPSGGIGVSFGPHARAFAGGSRDIEIARLAVELDETGTILRALELEGVGVKASPVIDTQRALYDTSFAAFANMTEAQKETVLQSLKTGTDFASAVIEAVARSVAPLP